MTYTTSSSVTVTYTFPTSPSAITATTTSNYRLVVKNSNGEFVYTDSSVSNGDTTLSFTSVALVTGLNQCIVQQDTDAGINTQGFKTLKSIAVTRVTDSSSSIAIAG